MRISSQRRIARDNTSMPAVSQGLIEFANEFRQPPGPGIEVLETPRYRVVLQPDLPIPGPNSASWIRCRPPEADDVVDEVRAIFTRLRMPFMWTLDPGTEPADFAARLATRGVHPDPHAPEVKVMVLPITATVEMPLVEGLELHDALAGPEAFRSWDAVNAEAFGSRTVDDDPELIAARERRRTNQLASGNRRLVLATVDGEPAGSAGMTLFAPAGGIINGGAVRPKFRGRGVYRAMVAARFAMARDAGVEGLSVWGAHTSAPILERLGFETVGWRKFFIDRVPSGDSLD